MYDDDDDEVQFDTAWFHSQMLTASVEKQTVSGQLNCSDNDKNIYNAPNRKA